MIGGEGEDEAELEKTFQGLVLVVASGRVYEFIHSFVPSPLLACSVATFVKYKGILLVGRRTLVCGYVEVDIIIIVEISVTGICVQ